MDNLFLLYLLAFVPVKGVNSGVIITTRDALFIQTGISQDYRRVKKNVEKKIPKPLIYTGIALKTVHDKKLRFKSRKFGTWEVSKDRVHVTWGFNW